jgi:hypothetical protein
MILLSNCTTTHNTIEINGCTTGCCASKRCTASEYILSIDNGSSFNCTEVGNSTEVKSCTTNGYTVNAKYGGGMYVSANSQSNVPQLSFITISDCTCAITTTEGDGGFAAVNTNPVVLILLL